MGVFLVLALWISPPPDSGLFVPDPAPPPDVAPLFQAFLQHQWKLVALLFASLLIGLVIRLLKDDTWFPTLPTRWRAPTAMVLGIVAGVLAHGLGGMGWGEAVGGGIAAAYAAIFGHITLIEGLRSGVEIPMPAWLRKPDRVTPTPPPSSSEDL